MSKGLSRCLPSERTFISLLSFSITFLYDSLSFHGNLLKRLIFSPSRCLPIRGIIFRRPDFRRFSISSLTTESFNRPVLHKRYFCNSQPGHNEDGVAEMPMMRCKAAAGRFPTPREPRASMGDLYHIKCNLSKHCFLDSLPCWELEAAGSHVTWGGFHRRCVLLFCNARFAYVRSKSILDFCVGHLDGDSAPHTLMQNRPFLPIGSMKFISQPRCSASWVYVKF